MLVAEAATTKKLKTLHAVVGAVLVVPDVALLLKGSSHAPSSTSGFRMPGAVCSLVHGAYAVGTVRIIGGKGRRRHVREMKRRPGALAALGLCVNAADRPAEVDSMVTTSSFCLRLAVLVARLPL